MSSVWDAVLSLAPYHLLSYGTLLGTELYQVRVRFASTNCIIPERWQLSPRKETSSNHS